MGIVVCGPFHLKGDGILGDVGGVGFDDWLAFWCHEAMRGTGRVPTGER